MNRISPKAVVLSLLLVLVLDTLVGAGLVAFHAGQIFVDGRTDEQVTQALRDLSATTAFLVASLVLGTLTTIVGGYAVVRIAKTFPYFNGLALGVLGCLWGIAFWSQYPAWFNLLGLALVVPAALLGAHIAVRRAGART